jgi:hypothetical protein
MNRHANDTELDELIARSINTTPPQFDLAAWKERFPDEFALLTSRAGRETPAPGLPVPHRQRPLLRIAVAAGLILGFGLWLHFSGTITSPRSALAQVLQAVRQASCLHVRNTVRRDAHGVGTTEEWWSFPARMKIVKEMNGTLTFFNYARREKTIFSPADQTITVSFLPERTFALGVGTPVEFLDKLTEMETARGGSLRRTVGRPADRDVEIFELSRPDPEGMEQVTLYVDPQTHLPLSAQVKFLDPKGTAIYEGEVCFEYPSAVPEDIYRAGAPATARVVNHLPASDLLRIHQVYHACRNKAPDRFVALAVFSGTNAASKRMEYAQLTYRDGERLKEEAYLPVTTDIGPQRRDDTFESQFQWWAKSPAGRLAEISLSDGTLFRRVAHKEDGKWAVTMDTECRPASFDGPHALGWPYLDITVSARRTTALVQDEYSVKNSLVCIRIDKKGNMPEEELYYLDPTREYLCQRYERHFKSLLIVDATDIRRTPSGYWYPRTKQYHVYPLGSPDKPAIGNFTETIYLDLDTQIPESTFDPRHLPR